MISPVVLRRSRRKSPLAGIMCLSAAWLAAPAWSSPFQEAGEPPEEKISSVRKDRQPGMLDPGAADEAGNEISKSEKRKIFDAWTKRFQATAKILHTGNAEVVKEAEAKILAERDPAALAPMLQVLGRETAPIRLLLDRNLAAREDELAWVALAERLLVEPEADVRRSLVRLVRGRPDHPGMKRFEQHIRNALKSNNAVRTGLGALAVADLGWNDAVPELVDLLAPVRFVRSVEWVPMPVSGGSGISMGSVNGYVVVPVPVVGPGVVAYGQQIIPVGNGLAMGGGGPSVSIRPVMKAGRMPQPNSAVRSALVALTGEDFGYDTTAWKAWVTEASRVGKNPPKRVPTP